MAEKDVQLKYYDNITDNEKEIAITALSEFKKKNYNGCLQALHKLEHRNFDFKVSHNIAVTEFYKRGLTKTKIFEKIIQNLCEQFKISTEKLSDVNYCGILYNVTLLLFNQRQYSLAIKNIERIYKFIEPMDNELAKLVCLLATELYLSVKLPDKAVTFIDYAETNLLLKELREIEDFKMKLAKYKLRCHLLKHEISAAAQGLKNIEQYQGHDVRFMSAHLDYLKGDYDRSVKTLASVPKNALIYENCGNCSNVLFYNNMAVIHHAKGKHNMATHYCKEALKEDLAIQSRIARNEDDQPMGIMGGSRYHEIMYNLGVSLLFSGKPSQAFECLIIAARRYHRNARLWLRIAECCICLHKESNESDYDAKPKEAVRQIVGPKYVLKTPKPAPKFAAESYAVPVPTLAFASICLRNALVSVPSEAHQEPAPMFGANPPTANPTPGPCPSAPLTDEAAVKLKNGILIASAYVALCIGDYVIALEHANDALQQTNISPVHRTLAHLYAAEALVLLDRITEAVEHLNPEHAKDLNFNLEQLPDGERIATRPPTKWFPQNVQTMVATFQYNLAVVKTIRGQYDHAEKLLTQICQQRSDAKIPSNVLMLIIYIKLQLGHLEIAKKLIKQHGLNLKGSVQHG